MSGGTTYIMLRSIRGTFLSPPPPPELLFFLCGSIYFVSSVVIQKIYFVSSVSFRYEKRHSNIPAHISPCFRVKEGDHVIIGQCRYIKIRGILSIGCFCCMFSFEENLLNIYCLNFRPLSKTVRFNVLKVIPAGSSSRGKKAFAGI